MTLETVRRLSYEQTSDPDGFGTFTIALGVAGWIDTDCSAVVGSNTDKVWLVRNASGGQLAGVRPHGSVLDSLIPDANHLSKPDAAGHFDFYRNAASDSYYTLMGWIG